jgi:hypothetical protein
MKGGNMKKNKIYKHTDIKPEYDFSVMKGGVRGKYYKSYRSGHKVMVHKTNGTTSVCHFKLEDGAVLLEPNVKKYFPDSESVNNALKLLIEIIPSKRRSTNHRK